MARLQPDDIRGQESSRQQLEYALSTLLPEPEPPTGGMPTEAPEAGRFQCQQCHKKYDSLTSLKKHMAISHKVKFTQCVAFDPARHAIGNLPQCAFCHHKFDTWHALKQHIQRLNCPILMQQVGLTGAVAPGASLEVRPSVAGDNQGMKILTYIPASRKMVGQLCSTHRMPSTFASIAVSAIGGSRAQLP